MRIFVRKQMSFLKHLDETDDEIGSGFTNQGFFLSVSIIQCEPSEELKLTETNT